MTSENKANVHFLYPLKTSIGFFIVSGYIENNLRPIMGEKPNNVPRNKFAF